ncbi:MAG: BrnA antitoxin family protein [Sulfuricaulis sp.]|uniref:BrnA antitoxin family protein n=1 Tax=Sulfuricaulis sp. TaxID=2003553 RepID=UPI0034A51EA2
MRKEYNLKKLKAKRRGMLPGLKAGGPPPAKVRITIALDDDVVEYFKAQSTRPGALPYQTQINQTLRRAIETGGTDAEALKTALLKDNKFLRAVARETRAATQR